MCGGGGLTEGGGEGGREEGRVGRRVKGEEEEELGKRERETASETERVPDLYLCLTDKASESERMYFGCNEAFLQELFTQNLFRQKMR